MPLVTLSDADFENLQTISKPFVDPTPEARISRLIRDEMARMGVTRNGNGTTQANGGVRLTTDALRRLSADSNGRGLRQGVFCNGRGNRQAGR